MFDVRTPTIIGVLVAVIGTTLRASDVATDFSVVQSGKVILLKILMAFRAL